MKNLVIQPFSLYTLAKEANLCRYLQDCEDITIIIIIIKLSFYCTASFLLFREVLGAKELVKTYKNTFLVQKFVCFINLFSRQRSLR